MREELLSRQRLAQIPSPKIVRVRGAVSRKLAQQVALVRALRKDALAQNQGPRTGEGIVLRATTIRHRNIFVNGREIMRVYSSQKALPGISLNLSGELIHPWFVARAASQTELIHALIPCVLFDEALQGAL